MKKTNILTRHLKRRPVRIFLIDKIKVFAAKGTNESYLREISGVSYITLAFFLSNHTILLP